METQARILVVEDEVAIAEDLADILRIHGHQVVGVAHSYDKAVDMLLSKKPNLVLLDIALQGNGSGIDIAHVINKKFHIPFIFITSFSDDETIEMVLETKPQGYIVKPFKEDDIHPMVKIAMLASNNENSTQLPEVEVLNASFDNTLSNQEYVVLQQMWKGLKNQEIADNIYVSVNTVKTHIQRIYSKLDVSSRVQLIKKIVKLMDQ